MIRKKGQENLNISVVEFIETNSAVNVTDAVENYPGIIWNVSIIIFLKGDTPTIILFQGEIIINSTNISPVRDTVIGLKPSKG